MVIDRHRRIPAIPGGIETAVAARREIRGLDPGGSETYWPAGSQIENTQSAMVLEKLINRLFATIAAKGSDSEESKE